MRGRLGQPQGGLGPAPGGLSCHALQPVLLACVAIITDSIASASVSKFYVVQYTKSATPGELTEAKQPGHIPLCQQ